ncbi:MAG: hypothetical protein HY908_30745, partial [Myxococcales bacterium]|nr:hypothetical protein [Myxococcales bacterium]
MSGTLLLNGNAEHDTELVHASVPWLGAALARPGAPPRPVLLVTAAWGEREHDEAHLKHALHEVGVASRLEEGFDRAIVNLSLRHELDAVLAAAPALGPAWRELERAVEAARAFYLAHNAHLSALVRRVLATARELDPGGSLAALLEPERGTRDARPGALVRPALRGELGHAIAPLAENDERMMAL